MAKEPSKLLIFMGSTRQGRNCDRVAKMVLKTLKENTPHQLEIIDPRSFDFKSWENPVHFYEDKSKIPTELAELDKKVQESDGFVFIVGEYNRCVQPALLQMMDYCAPGSFWYKTSMVIPYSRGMAGGATAGVDIRRILIELGMPPCPMKPPITIPFVDKGLDEDGTVKNELITKSMLGALPEFDWWLTATKNQRAATGKCFCRLDEKK